MSNTCHNTFIIKGELSPKVRASINATFETPLLLSDPEWNSTAEICFITHVQPAFAQVKSLQRQFPDLDIELRYVEPMNLDVGAVLSNGNFREEVIHMDWCGNWHTLGWRLFDPTGVILDSEIRDVPFLIRIRDGAMWIRNGVIGVLRRISTKRNPAAHAITNSDDIPF
jgi:hypothetical protein